MKLILNNQFIEKDINSFWLKLDFLEILFNKYGDKKIYFFLMFLKSLTVDLQTNKELDFLIKKLAIKIKNIENFNCPICLKGKLTNNSCVNCNTSFEVILDELIKVSKDINATDLINEEIEQNNCPICSSNFDIKTHNCKNCGADFTKIFICPFKENNTCVIDNLECNLVALEYEVCDKYHNNEEDY
jgi:hypothetical protein